MPQLRGPFGCSTEKEVKSPLLKGLKYKWLNGYFRVFHIFPLRTAETSIHIGAGGKKKKKKKKKQGKRAHMVTVSKSVSSMITADSFKHQTSGLILGAKLKRRDGYRTQVLAWGDWCTLRTMGLYTQFLTLIPSIKLQGIKKAPSTGATE